MPNSEAVAETLPSQPGKPNRRSPKGKPTTAVPASGLEFYLNRELTWLQFNKRVLHEAQDERTPLLERVKFAAITSSN